MSGLPWLARLLLRLAVPPDRREDVSGDLHVMHARRRTRGAATAWSLTALESVAVAGAFVVYRWRARSRGGGWISWPEFRIAVRQVRRQPVVTTTAVVALAVGIGLATVGFTFLDTMAYGTLPYPNGDRFVRILAYGEPHGERIPVDPDRYRVFQAQADRLAHLGAVRSTLFNVAFGPDGSDVELLKGAWLTPQSFAVLPATPMIGRLLSLADDDPAAVAVVVIRESLWQRRFGGSREVIGRTIRIAEVDRTIVGVLPNEFKFPNDGELWLPLDPAAIGGAWSAVSPNPAIGLFGVRAPGVSLAEVREQLATLSASVGADRRETEGVRMVVQGYTEPPFGVDILMVAFVGVLVLVLIVIASNVANLILARTMARGPELAVRAALGAGRGRLVRQIALEVLLIGTIAAILGTAGAAPLIQYIRQSIDGLPFWIVIEPSVATVIFVTTATLLATMVAGVVPALRATRGDPAAALRSAAPSVVTAIGKGGKAMITVEVALSVALLSVAIIMARGLDALVNPSLGIPNREILTFWVNLNSEDDPSADPASLRRTMLQAIAGVSGVRAAGTGSTLPGLSPSPTPIEVEPISGEESGPSPAPVAEVGQGFFTTFGEIDYTGRIFNANDYRSGAAPVAIVTRPFVDKFLEGRNPLGRRLRIVRADSDSAPPWREIVGVVPDLGMSVGDPSLAGGVYLPEERAPWFYLAVRTAGNPMRLVGPIRDAVAQAAPAVWLRHPALLDRVGLENRSFLAATSGSLTVVGIVALILSLAGIYAIMSLAVRQRTREIGLRMALGATPGQVLGRIFASAGWYLGLGAVAGAGLGLLLMQARGIFTFRLEAPGPWIFGIVMGLVAIAGLAACWIPGKRVLAIRPMEALKSE